jgi:hypothetical protein
MRTKRSTETKKPKARATKKIAAPQSNKKTWVASIDGLSLGIAGAAIVAAGILVAAYRPARPADAAAPTAIAEESAANTAAADTHSTTPANRAGSDGTAASGEQWPAPLTITGCLDRDGDEFRLTNAAGVGVPKTRSWKSGFLKKSNASAITVVDSSRHSRLQDHLGQQVSVTGMLVNREMQIGTLRSLSESCAEKTKI